MTTDCLEKEKEMEMINRFTTSPLTEDQVFTFTVTLCDNEVDRDFERFSLDALSQLCEMFVGKTGISDHSMRSKDQRARIFHTYISTDANAKTSVGENYTALKAKAYMVRNEENAALISEIEGGIKKEVSISCSMNKSTCSICGSDTKSHRCKHIRGRHYDGNICHAILSEPTDAYEWSFVAVPAQRKAGVTKAFRKKEGEILSDPVEIIKSLKSGSVLSEEEIGSIHSYISELEALAEDGAQYKKQLCKEISRLALITMPKVNFKSFISGCENMSAQQLCQFKDGLEAQAKEKIPFSPQLRHTERKEIRPGNNSFKI